MPRLRLVTPAPARSARRLAALTALLSLLGGLLAITAPGARAAEPPGWVSPTQGLDCVGVVECLVLSIPYTGSDANLYGHRVPGRRVVEFRAIPASDTVQPGLFNILDTRHTTYHQEPHCLAPVAPGNPNNEKYPLMSYQPCSTTKHWAFSVEPVGNGPRREVSPATWDPWSSFEDHSFDGFYLRVHRLNQTPDPQWEKDKWNEIVGGKAMCATTKATDLNQIQRHLDTFAECGASTVLSLHQPTATNDPGYKSQSQRTALSGRMLGWAVAKAADDCANNKALNWCKMQVTDPRTGEAISEWDRVGEVSLTGSNMPVVAGGECAGGVSGGTQSIYNGGEEPMTTTISASTTNEASTTVTVGLELKAEMQATAGFFSLTLGATAKFEQGRTWSASQTVGQDVAWTVPPRRYATAVIATSSLSVNANWEFGPPTSRAWRIINGANISVPYSSNPDATMPDTTMAVYNSWSRKDCNATGPSTLADGRQVGFANVTAPDPDDSPIVGDRLEANVDNSIHGPQRWWDVSAASSVPVNLRYQWYRVRGNDAPELIPGARGKTYTVTGDDVTDDEILPRFGHYHLFVGVTDVADPSRFDSMEYVSLVSGSVTEGPRSTASGSVGLTIVNPDTVATEETEVDITAAILNGTGPLDGTVSILDGGTKIAEVQLSALGKGKLFLPLTKGTHDLVAVYAGATPLDGMRSASARTTVKAAVSDTSLQAQDFARVGDDITVRATVTGRGATPTGTVQFFDGLDPVGAPVALDGAGIANAVLPGLATAGARKLWARYDGDATYAGSKSEQVGQGVGAKPSRTVLMVKGTVSVDDQVTLRATVTGDGTTPSGTVEFFDGHQSLGAPVSLDGEGVATTVVSGLDKSGSRRLWARYLGDPTYAGSKSEELSQSVGTRATATTLTAAAMPAGVGVPVLLTATVTSPDGTTPTGTVQFTREGTNAGTPVALVDGVATQKVTPETVGTIAYGATFQPNARFAGSEATRSVPVVAAVTTTALLIPKLSRGGGDATRLVATVRGGAVVPEGTMAFFANGEQIAAVKVDASGVANLRTKALPKGRLSLWAQFTPAPGSTYAASASKPAEHVVRRMRSRIGDLVAAPADSSGKVVVSGRVWVRGQRAKRPTGKVWLVHDGVRYAAARVGRGGLFRVGLPASVLRRGSNSVQVVYGGAAQPSLGASTRLVTVHRR